MLFYSVLITAGTELSYEYSQAIDETVPIHTEVLLPAFVLGCIIAYPNHSKDAGANHDLSLHPEINTPREQFVSRIVSGTFMVLVVLSMPMLHSSETATVPPTDAGGGTH